MKLAKVAILFEIAHGRRYWDYGLNIFELYIAEVLGHAGIPYEWVHDSCQLESCASDIVIVALAEETERTGSQLIRFAEKGGIVVSYAGLRCLAGKLGCREKPVFTPGYASLPRHLKEGEDVPLRFLQARPWSVDSDRAAGIRESGVLYRSRPDGEEAGAALLSIAVGSGSIDRWSVNIPYTIVGFQQGTGPVLADGIPAPDNTGNIDEGILKADDRCEMDWELDRRTTESGMPYYAYPYADLWREAAIAHLLRRAAAKGLTLPIVGHWPDGIEAVATISHDSDMNLDEHAERTLELLRESQVRTTWCMLEPGYGESVYRQVQTDGHELAFHYNALDADQGVWGEAEFIRQLEWLKSSAGIAEVATNKNHYTRFEGWGELFKWCERANVRCDQTRGPSKKGNVGFLFGTCHPYFPIAWASENNRLYDVLEIGFLTQDIEHFLLADFSVVWPFLETVKRVEGVAHFLFHQMHLYEQPAVAAALQNVVKEAGSRGFVFWTSGQINKWERARRTVKVNDSNGQGNLRITGSPEAAGAIVWLPLPEGCEPRPASAVKFGIPCEKLILD